jgi:uncharacterized protein YbjT (DUF2867 family)
MTALVTGGTGVLGRRVTSQLLDRNVDVRVLTRGTATHGTVGAGRPRYAHGDLATGEGVAEAVAGVDTVVHCASAAGLRFAPADVEGTRRLLDAAQDAEVAHLVFISIVGIDTIPFGYYRAKLEVERMIAGSGIGWTVLRTTQFHELVLQIVATLARPPLVAVPRGVRFQSVESGDVAARMVDLALGAPAGRVADLGGPRVDAIEDLARAYLSAVGRRRPVVRVPLPGAAVRALRAGNNLVPHGQTVGRTFADFLAERVGDDRTVTLPYGRRRR